MEHTLSVCVCIDLPEIPLISWRLLRRTQFKDHFKTLFTMAEALVLKPKTEQTIHRLHEKQAATQRSSRRFEERWRNTPTEVLDSFFSYPCAIEGDGMPFASTTFRTSFVKCTCII